VRKEQLDVRLYVRREGGEFEVLFIYSVKFFDGIVPAPGDTIAIGEGEFGSRIFRVLDRCFVTHFGGDSGWALFVEQPEDDGDLKEFAQWWAEDTKLFNAAAHDMDDGGDIADERIWPLVETAETLDRDNRDPAYWTFERKEILRKEREKRLAAIRAGLNPKR